MDDGYSAKEQGRMGAELENLERAVQILSQKVDLLLEERNKARGVAWAFLGFASLAGTLIGWFIGSGKGPHP